MIETVVTWLVDLVQHLGYPGIFIMTFLESTVAPIPSELTMIPAGYLISKGEMHFVPVFLLSIAGTVCGSLFNYWMAYHFGRRFLMAYGKYMFFPPEKMEKLERYFRAHGEISTFTGRLIPGLRHFISIPAGLAHMDLKRFCLFTGLGGSIWMFTLIVVGYVIGGNKELVKEYMPMITYATIAIVMAMIAGYVIRHRRKKALEP